MTLPFFLLQKCPANCDKCTEGGVCTKVSGGAAPIFRRGKKKIAAPWESQRVLTAMICPKLTYFGLPDAV